MTRNFAAIDGCAHLLPAPPSAAVVEALRRIAAGASSVDVLYALERDPSVAVAAEALASSPVFPDDDERDWRRVVLLAALERRVFRAPGNTDVAVRLRVHSMAVAFASSVIAPFASVSPSRAFDVGLFHDAGLLLGNAAHERASAGIAAMWGLDTRAIATIAEHHDPARQLDAASAVLSLADAFAVEEGFGVDLVEQWRALDPPVFSVDAGLRAIGMRSIADRRAVGAAVDRVFSRIRAL